MNAHAVLTNLSRMIFMSLMFAVFSPLAIAGPMTLEDYLSMSGPAPDARIPYGSADSQFAELFLPAATGMRPVVALLHGGCWAHKYGGLRQVAGLAKALANEGIAVWSIEYRGIDEAGGGYPGTYQDVAAALAKLRDEAPSRHLDISRLVIVGHSAGAQLALWAAARGRIDKASPLFAPDPVPVAEVIGLGTLPDLHDVASIERGCELDPVALTGEPASQRENVFADTSPIDMIPSGVRTVLINGELDGVAPAILSRRYAQAARNAGDNVRTVLVPNASHYDEVSVDSPVWRTLNEEIMSQFNGSRQ